FIPYQRDRYGNFVASTTVGIPLESNPGKLNAGEWAAYKAKRPKVKREIASNKCFSKQFSLNPKP
ncbi:MAG: hypothetical protein EOO98_16520, partial [Pedobacter sp.]